MVTDFDNTLNKNKYRQQIYDTSYGIFKKSDYLSLEFRMNLKLLYSFFYNELEKLYETKDETFINHSQQLYDYEVRKYWYSLNNRYI